MPNWCVNTLIVNTGDKPELERFKAETADPQGDREEQILSFAALVPEPEYKNPDDWYNWRIENWGCKWNPSEPDVIDETSDSVQYSFDTSTLR